MNTGGVSERASPNNRLVRRDRHVANLAHGLAGAPDFVVIDASVHVHNVFAHFDRHDHFFQRAVAGTFTNAIHCPFYLTRAGVDGGDGIAHSQAQIVMGMHGDDGFINIWHAIVQTGDDAGELKRHGVADGVRDVDGSGSGINRGFHYTGQIVNRRAACIFTGEFDVISVVTRAFDHIHRTFNHFIQRTAQLGRNVHGGGGNECMDTESFCNFQGFRGHINIFLYAASQTAHAAVFDGAGDGLY